MDFCAAIEQLTSKVIGWCVMQYYKTFDAFSGPLEDMGQELVQMLVNFPVSLSANPFILHATVNRAFIIWRLCKAAKLWTAVRSYDMQL